MRDFLFSVPSGEPVAIEPFHYAIIGQTQFSGKTTLIKQLSDWVATQGYNVLIFDTKETEADYAGFGNEVPVCLRETTDSFVLIGLLESMFKRRLTPYYATLSRLTEASKGFDDIIKRAKDLKSKTKSGWLRDACRVLYDLLERLQGETSKVETVPQLKLYPGINRMVINDFSLEAQQLMEAFRDRQPATDVFVRGDVAVDVVPSLTKDVNVQFWLDYLYKQREAVLGVPKIFLGESERTNRATAEIVMQEYVTRLRMLQELVGDTLETVLFKQLLEAKFGEGVEVPTIKWRPIWEPTLDVKAKFISDLVDKNIILRSEARPQLGYPEQPTDEALAAENMLPLAKPKSETSKAVDRTVNGVVEALQSEE